MKKKNSKDYNIKRSFMHENDSQCNSTVMRDEIRDAEKCDKEMEKTFLMKGSCQDILSQLPSYGSKKYSMVN
jgi:hypothetical protein